MIYKIHNVNDALNILRGPHEEPLIFDLDESFEATDCPFSFWACLNCGEKIIRIYDSTYEKCAKCGCPFLWNHQVDLVIQGDMVIYRREH